MSINYNSGDIIIEVQEIIYTNTGSGGATIDDATVSTVTTWSSQKISDELSTKADVSHTHTTTDITDFNTQVDSKISSHNTDNTAHTDIRNELATKPNIDDTTPSTSTVYSSQKVEDRLSTKADVSHTHTISDISNLQTELDNKLSKFSTFTSDDIVIINTDGTLKDSGKKLSDYALINHNHLLTDISDISITTPTNNQILKYNSTTGKWENTDFTHTHTTSEITDFNTQVDSKISAHNTDNTAHTDIRNEIATKPDINDTTPSTTTVYSSQKVEDRLSTKSDIGHTHTLDSLSNVDTTTKSDGQTLVWDATNNIWKPITITSGATIDDTVIATDKTWSSQKISDELSTKANTTHTHTISDISNLQTELDNKLNKFSTFTSDDIVIINIDGTLKDSGKKLSDYALINHTHTVADITDFNTQVDNKISAHNTDTTAHSDIRSAVNSKPDIDDTTPSTSTVYSSQKVEDRLSTKADITHTHTLNDLSDVDTTGVSDGQALTYDATSGLWIPKTLAGGSGGTAGLTLVADIRITTTSERTSAIDITGLDLATDEEYLIFFSFTWNELNSQSGLIYFNNDFTDTNYFYHFNFSSTAGGLTSSGDGAIFIKFPNAWEYDYTGCIWLQKPEHYSAVARCFWIDPTFSREGRSYVTWKVTGQNVTTLNFRTTSTVTDFYKEPSRIKIYKLRG